MILGIRLGLGLGLGFRLGLGLVRVDPNPKSNPNPKNQIRVFRIYWTWNYYHFLANKHAVLVGWLLHLQASNLHIFA